MSEAWALLLAVAAVAGAIAGADGHLPAVAGGVAIAGPIGLVVAGGAALAALAARRPAWLCLGVALLAAVLAQRSVAGLAPPPAGPVWGKATLVSDPEPDGRGGVAVDVRLDGRRLRGFARSSAAAALDDRLAGERVTVVGRVERPGPWEQLLRHRHLAGRLVIQTVTDWRPGGAVWRAANGLRRTLASGAESLPARQQSLLAGLTLGDDRAQPPDMADAFEAAGLTHLLAVSGQNVAFALVIASPVLARLRFGPRLAATLAVLAGFALLTRFEPSVLRATAMAAVAATGTAFGRPSSSRRALGLGVAGMVLVDPMLATSLGFQLSAAATAGIVLGARPIEGALPGPRWLAAPLSLTIAAQLAVAPLLVAAFGALPVASLPANVLAGPVAGPVMVWGLTGGLVAGLAGGPLAGALHLPTRLMLTWLEGVALAATRLPLGSLDVAHLALAAAGLALLLAARSLAAPARSGSARSGEPSAPSGAAALRPVSSPPPAPGSADGPDVGASGWRGRARWARAVGVGLVVAALVGAAWPRPVATGPVELGIGATAWRGRHASVLVVDGRAHAETVLGGLREAGGRGLDVVVLRSNARSTGDLLAVLRRRWPRVHVVAPPAAGDRTPPAGARAAVPGTAMAVGDLTIAVASAGPGHLDVDVALATPASGGPR